MKVNIDRLKCLALFLPHVIIYLFLFWISMYTADDRSNYIKFLADPYDSTRFEILFVKLGQLLYNLGFDPVYSLFSIQVFAIFLYYRLFYLVNKNQVLMNLSIASFIMFSVFSNPFGIQLRFGLASIICLTLYTILNKKKYYFLFLIPAFYHYGTIPFILCFLSSKIRPVIPKKTFVLMFFLLVFFMSNSIFLLVKVLGLGDYYLTYFNGEEAGIISITFLFYVGLSILNFYYSNRKKNIFWLPFVGIVLGVVGIITHINVFYKMMLPFVLLAVIEFLKGNFFLNNKSTYFMFFYVLSFLSIFYYAYMTKLL